MTGDFSFSFGDSNCSWLSDSVRQLTHCSITYKSDKQLKSTKRLTLTTTDASMPQ